MKKIFLLLMACTLLAACDHDDNTSVVPEKPYFNPVEGKWANKQGNPNRSLFVFTEAFNVYIYAYTNNALTSKVGYGKYTITDKTILYEDGSSVDYSIVEDTLYLITPQQTRKYIKTDEVLPE